MCMTDDINFDRIQIDISDILCNIALLSIII